MTEEFCTGGGQDGKLGRGGAAGAVRRQRGCGGAADHGRRAEAGRAVSRRADVRRRYRGAGPASAHADGAARQHAGGARPGGAGTGLLRRGRAGHGAGGRRGQAAARLLRRRLPGTGAALCFETKTDTRRGPSAPESENTVKGAKDAFTETMRINTSLLRRHLRSAQLRFVQKTVGLRSQTAVTVCSSGAWSSGWRRSTSTGC